MTNPTADAAKLLPCPTCKSERPEWRRAYVADGKVQTCRDQYHDTRPQPTPPAGEPDFIEQATAARASWALQPTTSGDPLHSLIEAYLFRAGYRLGLSARPKVEEAEVVGEITQLRSTASNAPHWVAVLLRHAADLLERLSVHNEGLRLDCAQWSREFATAEAKLDERDAELAMVQCHLMQSDYAHYMRTLPDTAIVTETNWLDYEKDAVLRHRNRVRRNRCEPEITTDAARQQQKASAEKDKPAAKGADNG